MSDIFGIWHWFRQTIKEDEEKTICLICGHNYKKSKRRCPRCGEKTYNPRI